MYPFARRQEILEFLNAGLLEFEQKGVKPEVLIMNLWEWGLMGSPVRCLGKTCIPHKTCAMGNAFWLTGAWLPECLWGTERGAPD